MSSEYEDIRKFIPSTHTSGSFDTDIVLDFERAQAENNQLWLFQFPPQITTADVAKSGIEIPIDSKLTAAGKQVFIGKFSVGGTTYNLHESQPDSVSNIVNFWTSEHDAKTGQVFRGKPFVRFFVISVEVANNLIGPHQIIDNMPMGYNKLFQPEPILLPLGYKNPWFGTNPSTGQPNNTNILNQLADQPFSFTSGNFDLTLDENNKWAEAVELANQDRIGEAVELLVNKKKSANKQQQSTKTEKTQHKAPKQSKADKKAAAPVAQPAPVTTPVAATPVAPVEQSSKKSKKDKKQNQVKSEPAAAPAVAPAAAAVDVLPKRPLVKSETTGEQVVNAEEKKLSKKQAKKAKLAASAGDQHLVQLQK